MPAVRLSEARLEASDVGALVREAHPRGSGLVGGAWWASRKDVQPSRARSCVEWGWCAG